MSCSAQVLRDIPWNSFRGIDTARSFSNWWDAGAQSSQDRSIVQVENDFEWS